MKYRQKTKNYKSGNMKHAVFYVFYLVLLFLFFIISKMEDSSPQSRRFFKSNLI